MLDPITQGFISPEVALKHTNLQGGSNVLMKLTSSPARTAAGFVSAGVTCDMLFPFVRKRLRARSATTMQQQVQPDSVKHTFWAEQVAFWAASSSPQQVFNQLLQLPRRTLIVALVAFIGFGCASWGASRRRKRKLDMRNFREGRFVPLNSMEQDEPDAEPKGIRWWTSIPGDDLRRSMSDLNGTFPTASIWRKKQNSRLVLPVKSLDDEPEEEDSVGVDRRAVPGDDGFVAQQAAVVECAVQFFRMNTDVQLPLADEYAFEQPHLDSRVVPAGLVRSSTAELERQIQRNPLVPRG